MIQYRPQPEAIDLHELHRQLCHDLAEHRNADPVEAAPVSNPAISELAEQLMSVTRQLFPPGPLEICLQSDPDDEERDYLIFTVAAEGDSRSLLERRHQWHLQVDSLVGQESINIRLSVYPR